MVVVAGGAVVVVVVGATTGVVTVVPAVRASTTADVVPGIEAGPGRVVVVVVLVLELETAAFRRAAEPRWTAVA